MTADIASVVGSGREQHGSMPLQPSPGLFQDPFRREFLEQGGLHLVSRISLCSERARAEAIDSSLARKLPAWPSYQISQKALMPIRLRLTT